MKTRIAAFLILGAFSISANPLRSPAADGSRDKSSADLVKGIIQETSVEIPADSFGQQELLKKLLASYFDPEIPAITKSVKIITRVNHLIFVDAIDHHHYEDVMEVVKNDPEMKSDSGMELLVFMQSVWEQRFGPAIRQNLRDGRWGREGVIAAGGILGYAGSFLYSRGKVGAVSRLASQLIPYVGLGGGYVVSKKTYDPKSAANIPRSPFEILSFGNDRPEDHHWNSGDSLAWNLAEVMAGITAFPIAKNLTNKVASRFVEKKNCLDAAELVLNRYFYQKSSLSFLKDARNAGVVAFKALRSVKNGEAIDWKLALKASKEELGDVKNYAKNYATSWGPIGFAGGVAGYFALQMSMSEYGHHLSSQSLREIISESENKLSYFKSTGQNQELLMEGYRFRSYIEYYSDVLMFDVAEKTEEQLYHAIVKSAGSEASVAELEKINHAIRKTYSKLEWQIFESRIQAFVDATAEYQDLQMPGLYREVMTDGLPYDSGNVLLYGASVLHQDGLSLEFDRIREKIAYVYAVYKTMSSPQGGVDEKN